MEDLPNGAEIKLKELPIGDEFENEDSTRFRRISKTELQIVDVGGYIKEMGGYTKGETILLEDNFGGECILGKIGKHLWFLD